MKKVTNTAKPCPAMIRAIETLISNNQPDKFMEFLAEAMVWVHSSPYEDSDGNKDDGHYTCLKIIQNVIRPWLKGGENVIENIAKELIAYEEDNRGWNDSVKNQYRYCFGAILYSFGDQGPLGISANDIAGYKSIMDIAYAVDAYRESLKTHSKKAA